MRPLRNGHPARPAAAGFVFQNMTRVGQIANRIRALPMRAASVCGWSVLTLLAAAPIFIVFEVWQLVMSERYLGMKQIARGVDPRELGLRETTAFFWSALLISYWLWMLLLLFAPMGRTQGGGLLLIWMIGFSLRRGARFKWILVILTFEGAIRIGLLLSLCAIVWRRYF
jgi:hypothetical protein